MPLRRMRKRGNDNKTVRSQRSWLASYHRRLRTSRLTRKPCPSCRQSDGESDRLAATAGDSVNGERRSGEAAHPETSEAKALSGNADPDLDAVGFLPGVTGVSHSRASYSLHVGRNATTVARKDRKVGARGTGRVAAHE